MHFITLCIVYLFTQNKTIWLSCPNNTSCQILNKVYRQNVFSTSTHWMASQATVHILPNLHFTTAHSVFSSAHISQSPSKLFYTWCKVTATISVLRHLECMAASEHRISIETARWRWSSGMKHKVDKRLGLKDMECNFQHTRCLE